MKTRNDEEIGTYDKYHHGDLRNTLIIAASKLIQERGSAGLEVVRALNGADVTTLRPIQIVNWTNEEGSRFVPSMGASGVYAGLFEEQDILAETDDDGVSFAEALDGIGYRGAEVVGERKFHAFFELHIEQGPVLEARDMEIGVVTGSQAVRHTPVPHPCPIVPMRWLRRRDCYNAPTTREMLWSRPVPPSG